MDDILRQDGEDRRRQGRGEERRREETDQLVEKRLKFGWMTYRGRTVRRGGGKGEETAKERRQRGGERRL